MSNPSSYINIDGWAAPPDALEDMPSAAAQQACVECRRKKAKCDRKLPTCGLCSKYTIACLYEKQYRTPLTRRYGFAQLQTCAAFYAQ